MKRRASSAPLLHKCVAAAYGGDDTVLLNRIDPAGILGTATHKACEQIVLGEGANTGAIAAEYNLTEPAKIEMIKMVAAFTRWWAENLHRFPDPQVELELEHDGVTGHVDIIAKTVDTLYVIDIKTTRLEDVDYSPQLKTYLWLASKNLHLVGDRT